MKNQFYSIRKSIALFSFILCLHSCAPVNSIYDNAKLIEKGKSKFIASVTKYKSSGKNENNERVSQNLQNNLGIAYTYGLSDKVNLSARYENLKYSTVDYVNGQWVSVKGTEHYISLAAKLRIKNEKMALYLPLEIYTGNVSIAPQFFYTGNLKTNKIDYTVAPKLIIPLGENLKENGYVPLLGMNLGMGFSGNIAKYAIRPEIGILLNPKRSFTNFNYNFGLGLTINI